MKVDRRNRDASPGINYSPLHEIALLNYELDELDRMRSKAVCVFLVCGQVSAGYVSYFCGGGGAR